MPLPERGFRMRMLWAGVPPAVNVLYDQYAQHAVQPWGQLRVRDLWGPVYCTVHSEDKALVQGELTFVVPTTLYDWDIVSLETWDTGRRLAACPMGQNITGKPREKLRLTVALVME
jgi:hypothetical protein